MILYRCPVGCGAITDINRQWEHVGIALSSKCSTLKCGSEEKYICISYFYTWLSAIPAGSPVGLKSQLVDVGFISMLYVVDNKKPQTSSEITE